jgi:site-specific DNA recombinase
MGLLYDSDGNLFTPSHTAKKDRRYRYYVSQAVIKNPGTGTKGPARLPAQEIEDLVVSQLTSFLQSPQRLLDQLGTSFSTTTQTQQIVAAARQWANASREKVQALIKANVTRAVVRDDRVRISISRKALREAMLGPQEI